MNAKILYAALFFLLPAPNVLACPAESFVISAGKAFQMAARSNSASAFSGAAARYTDLRAISLFALGQYRGKLAKSSEAQYLALSRRYMGAFLVEYGSKFSGNGVTIVSCQGNVVNAKFTGGEKIVFRLSKSGGSYRVQDASLSGFWLAQQMRTKFTRIISKGGGDVGALLRFLRG